MITINELLAAISPSNVTIWGEVGNFNIKRISFDSRDMEASTVFFAYKGESYDSFNDAEKIYKEGMTRFIVTEKFLSEYIPHAVVKNGRVALAKAAEAFFDYPLKSYTAVAVTGTNGKTTTTYILDEIFKAAGHKTLRIGTTGIGIAGENYSTENTTPASHDIYKYLHSGLNKGCSFVSMEVSSHALAQQRIGGIKFNAAIFTNLTGDHLDFHKDMEHYFLAKAMLFNDEVSEYKIINISNPYGKRLVGMVKNKNNIVAFSNEREGDIFPLEYESGVFGINALLSVYGKQVEIKSHLIGGYNLENIMGAVAASAILGVDLTTIVKGVNSLLNVPGRLEKYVNKGVALFVDYAHTDDALKNTIEALRPVTEGNLVTIFGAGGDRDKTKRPRMGKVASILSDKIIITNDNPRGEDPNEIINDILSGIDKDCNKEIIIETDREKAIEKAINQAKSGDVILLAGKGHEEYQIVGQTKYPFSDKAIAKKYLEI